MVVHNKLVRDNIPDIIAAEGKTPITRILSDAEYKLELINKLSEELDEFKVDSSIEELADIQEVVQAIASLISSSEELEQVRLQKVNTRGAFINRIFLESVD